MNTNLLDKEKLLTLIDDLYIEKEASKQKTATLRTQLCRYKHLLKELEKCDTEAA